MERRPSRRVPSLREESAWTIAQAGLLQVCASGREREFESKASLVSQNGILLLINALGVWRWLPKAEKEIKS
jgi:hypothetical protein